MKKLAILILCIAMVMAFAALAVFAENEVAEPPIVRGFTYFEDKTVFRYYHAEASAVSVKVYAGAEDAEALATYPMTKGEDGVWYVTAEGDQQQRYYTFAYTVGEETLEVADPTNNADLAVRSYIPALVKYELWVAGIQVNNFNAQDILGDADVGELVRYDAAANTLIFAMGANVVSDQPGVSYAGTETLIVKLEGDAHITSTQVALQTTASVTVTADAPSVLYAAATGEESAGIVMGENAVLTLEGRAFVHASSAKQAGLQLSAGAKVLLGEKNVLSARGSGEVADLQAADENFTIPMEWITTGKFFPLSGRPGVKLTIGDDPTPYTYAGCPGEQYGIVINAETPDHSVWLTYGTWETGSGYVAYTKTEEARKVVLYNAQITNAYGPALHLAEQTEIVLRGENILTGVGTGLEVTNATITGYHGMLAANGIKIAESLVVKEGMLKLEGDQPLFGEILPDLSQYNGEYTIIIEQPAPPEVTPPEGEGEVTTPEGEVTPPEGEVTPPEGEGEGEVTPPAGEGTTPEGEGTTPEGGTTGEEPAAPIDNEETPTETPETGGEGTEGEGGENGGEGTEGETPEVTPPTDTPVTPPAPEPPKYSYILTPQRDHTMDPWVEGSKPDCITDGVAGHQKCTVCGLYLDADGNEIPAAYLPVAYDSHDFTYSPLEDKDVHLSTCSRNPAHVYTTACFGGGEICLERRICEGCGEKHGDRLFHIFGTDYTHSDEVGHWSMCQRPGCSQPDDPKAHSGGFINCNSAYVCEVCGHEYGGVAGHSYTKKASDQLVSEATCTKPAQYLAKCDHCDSVHESMTVSVGKSLPHTYDGIWVTNNAGHWQTCTVCSNISAPERHVETVVGQVKATTEAPGYTGDIYCSVCDVLVFKGSSLPPLENAAGELDPMVFVAIGTLAVSGLGFAGVIVFGAVKKKKTGQ